MLLSEKRGVDGERRGLLLFIFSSLLSLFCAYFVVFREKTAILPLGLLLFFLIAVYFYRHQFLVFWGVLLSTPFNDHLSIPLGGLNLRGYTLFVALGILIFLVKLFCKKWDATTRCAAKIFPLFLPLIGLVMSKVLTIYFLDALPPGMSKKFSVKYAIIHTLLYQLAFITAISIKDKREYLVAIKTLLIIANGIFFLAIVQIILSNAAGFHYVHHRDVIFFGRPYSVFREPDVLASFVAATLMIAFPLYHSDFFTDPINTFPVKRRKNALPLFSGRIEMALSPLFFSTSISKEHSSNKTRNIISKRLLLITMSLHGFLLLILFVRAAWVATIVAFSLYLLSLAFSSNLDRVGKLLKKIISISIVSTLFLSIFAPSFAGKIVERFSTIVSSEGKQESAKEYRKMEIREMIAQTVGKGVNSEHISTLLLGYGDFSWSYWAPLLLGEDYDQDAEKNAGSGGVLIHPGFNFFLSILYDNGVIGISFYLLFLYLLFKHFWRRVKNPSLENKELLFSAYLPIVVMVICFVFSYDPITPFFWILIGLYLGWCNQIEGEKSV